MYMSKNSKILSVKYHGTACNVKGNNNNYTFNNNNDDVQYQLCMSLWSDYICY